MSMIEEYQRAGFTCIEGLFNKEEVLDIQLATDKLIEQSRSHITSDEKFDLEHTVRRNLILKSMAPKECCY